MRRLALLALVLAGCTQFPALEDSIEPAAEDAEFPDLVPLEPILAAETTRRQTRQANDTVQAEDAIRARREALRARAEGLRRGVIDPETQTRMQQGVSGG